MARTIDDEIAAKKAEGKPPVQMVPKSAIYAIANQMEYGAEKHGRDDWKKGLPWSQRIGSIMRHLLEFASGIDIDPESGRPHLDGVLTQAAMLKEYTRTHPELDDRPKPN